jgi:hypothetical protein
MGFTAFFRGWREAFGATVLAAVALTPSAFATDASWLSATAFDFRGLRGFIAGSDVGCVCRAILDFDADFDVDLFEDLVVAGVVVFALDFG